MQNIQKLRNIYSSSNDKKSRINSLIERASTAQIGGIAINRPLNTASSASNNNFNNINSNNVMDTASTTKEMSKGEVQQVLLTKIKEFRDMINNNQRQNNTDMPIIPAEDFKNILRGLGIVIGKEVKFNLIFFANFIIQTLRKFIT